MPGRVQPSRFTRLCGWLAAAWETHRSILPRYTAYAVFAIGVAIFCALFPPAPFMLLPTLAWQFMIPITILSLSAMLEKKLDMSGYEPLLWLIASMLLSAAFAAMFAPAMPAALLAAASAASWKVLAICSCALAPLGYALIFYAMNNQPSEEEDWLDAIKHWWFVLLGTLLTMPALMVLMPGAMVAFASAVVPSAGGVPVVYSAMALSNLVLKGILDGTAIVFGIIAAVQTLGVVLEQGSYSIPKAYPATQQFFSGVGDALVWLALLLPVVLSATLSAVGHVMLQGLDFARRGLVGLAPPFNVPNPFQLMVQASQVLAQASQMLPSAYTVYQGVIGVIMAAGSFVWGCWQATKNPVIGRGDKVGGDVPVLTQWRGEPTLGHDYDPSADRDEFQKMVRDVGVRGSINF